MANPQHPSMLLLILGFQLGSLCRIVHSSVHEGFLPRGLVLVVEDVVVAVGVVHVVQGLLEIGLSLEDLLMGLGLELVESQRQFPISLEGVFFGFLVGVPAKVFAIDR